MKNYGDKKATEFTKKQVGVLFFKAKRRGWTRLREINVKVAGLARWLS